MPGFGGNYPIAGPPGLPPVPTPSTVSANGMSVSQPGNYFPPQDPTAGYPSYPHVSQQAQIGPPMMENNNNLVNDYNGQQHVHTPDQYQPTSSQQVSPAQALSSTLGNGSTIGQAGPGSYDSSFLDPNDPSLFNFNISDLNFGNHYGALEFGMLGHCLLYTSPSPRD